MCTVVTMHPSVKKVAEFMEKSLETNELRGVAEALYILAPALWRYYPVVDVLPVSLDEVVNPLSQSTASQ